MMLREHKTQNVLKTYQQALGFCIFEEMTMNSEPFSRNYSSKNLLQNQLIEAFDSKLTRKLHKKK